MRAIVLVVLFFVLGMSLVSSFYCRRLLPLLTFIVTAIEMMYFGIVDNSSGKDKLLTKMCVLTVSALTVIMLLSSYNFVYKPEAPYLSNGRDTLWDTQTEELADEICAGCETDEEKVRAFYGWIVSNFEYDHDCYPVFQYFDVRKTLQTKQGICFDFPICLPRSVVVRIFRAMPLTVCSMIVPRRIIPGIESILMAHGGIWT